MTHMTIIPTPELWQFFIPSSRDSLIHLLPIITSSMDIPVGQDSSFVVRFGCMLKMFGPNPWVFNQNTICSADFHSHFVWDIPGLLGSQWVYVEKWRETLSTYLKPQDTSEAHSGCSCLTSCWFRHPCETKILVKWDLTFKIEQVTQTSLKLLPPCSRLNKGHYITNPNNALSTGNPSRLPYICIKSDPPKIR